jgi:hypothetical protein
VVEQGALEVEGAAAARVPQVGTFMLKMGIHLVARYGTTQTLTDPRHMPEFGYPLTEGPRHGYP